MNHTITRDGIRYGGPRMLEILWYEFEQQVARALASPMVSCLLAAAFLFVLSAQFTT